MRTGSTSGLGRFRRAPLAAQLVGMFALADASVTLAATTWTVSSCNNVYSGSGSTGTLRYALFNATDGDTVDMTGLVCSTITLTDPAPYGPLPIPKGTTTVLGPGRDKLTINADNVSPIFSYLQYSLTPPHLILKDLTLSNGYAYSSLSGPKDGGCIGTVGSIELDRVTLTHCHATGSGGGISALKATLDHSTVTLSVADAFGAGIVATHVDLTSSVASYNEAGTNGGGIWGADVSLTDSTVTYNYAGRASAGHQGGGMFVSGNLTLTRSTVDHNFAHGGQGGILAYNASPEALTATIIDSTISSNFATSAVGGIYVNSGVVKLYNSTIAFNRAGLDSPGFSAGMATANFYGDIDLRFHSALITNNYGGTTPHDFSFEFGGGHSRTDSGANNFVRFPDFSLGPFDHQGGCPRLGPLRDNGGPTQTHALLSGSGAINVGDNVESLPNDQRGAPFARAVGVADIGAYEEQAEIIFNSGFDDC